MALLLNQRLSLFLSGGVWFVRGLIYGCCGKFDTDSNVQSSDTHASKRAEFKSVQNRFDGVLS